MRCEDVTAASCFEVCRTSKLPAKGRFSCFSLVRKEPKVHQRFANLWTPGTIQIAGRYVIVVKTTDIHQVTGNAENSSFRGIAGNDLNRCEVPTLQHKIRAKSKRTAVFFANSRLRGVEMGGGGQKRIALDRNKEKFVRIKGFLYVKRRLLRTVKSRSNEQCFACENERLLREKRKAFCK